MKRIILLAIVCITLSCGHKKELQLPEISHSDITEIQDVSAAYLFYNETKPDSVELNRKNLISTTNWLINVDKRLTLKQAIPHIKFLQEKKANSSHKNKKAKNYFTCHDTSINDLGFIEFTDVDYKTQSSKESSKKKLEYIYNDVSIYFGSLKSITIDQSDGYCATIVEMHWKDFVDKFSEFGFDEYTTPTNIYFDEKLLFQDYITFKSFLQNLKKDNLLLSNSEFIF